MIDALATAIAFVVVAVIVTVTQFIWDYREIRDDLKA